MPRDRNPGPDPKHDLLIIDDVEPVSTPERRAQIAESMDTFMRIGTMLLSDNCADLAILGRANDKRRMAMPVGVLRKDIGDALLRAIDAEWINLVDITPLPNMPGLFRVFRLTDKGQQRLSVLKLLGLT